MTRPAPERFVEWVRQQALPFWATHGFDAHAGRFHERLDGSGRPLAVPHRAMLQSRQIYVFAHAATLGWLPEGRELAARAMATMRREFCVHADGCASVHFSIDTDPVAPRSAVRDAYAHAFVLFAAAFLHGATGDAGLLDFADEVGAYVDRALIDPVHGGAFTTADDRAGEKLQNPQMHLLEAYLALAEQAPERGWRARAARLVALFEAHLLRRDLGVLPERFAPDWRPHADPTIAGTFEPGHHYEWIWLLDWYERLTGENLADARARLLAAAAQPAAAQNGLIRDQLHADGRVIRDAHRLWPHCEAIKAAVAAPRGLADPAAARLAEASAAALLDHFVARPFPAGWTDQIGPDRAPLVDYVPASSLYHLMLAAAVLDGAAHAPARLLEQAH